MNITPYVICTAPRSGSTMLSEALTATGRAGAPNEYFDIYDYNEQFWRRTLGIVGDADYVDRVVRAGTTPNGVFGLKLLWHQSPALVAKLTAGLPGRPAGSQDSLHGLFTAKIGEPKYIWLRRQNKLAQAISYYRASQTGLWRSHDKPSRHSLVADEELPYDFDKIGRYLQSVNRFDESWEAYFRFNRVKVLVIFYENFVGAFEPTILSVFDFLGLPREGLALASPRLQRQGDRRSAEWEERFRATFAARQSTFAATHGAAPMATPPGNGAAALAEKPATPAAAPAEKTPLPLLAYAVVPHTPRITKARPQRAWMDATPKRFAYRCLPMVIANQAGWLVAGRDKIAVTWNGGVETNALTIQYLSGSDPRAAVSLFGCGIVTFTIPYVFRTPPGYNLYVHGPANSPKDGIAALEGIVESDWTESTFTMNWKVTRPNHPIVFEEGEPIAMITPTPRHELERFSPEIWPLAHNPDLETLHREWATSRMRHNADLRVPNSQAQQDGWQRHYMRGTSIRQEPAAVHQTALLLKEFDDKRR